MIIVVCKTHLEFRVSWLCVVTKHPEGAAESLKVEVLEFIRVELSWQWTQS